MEWKDVILTLGLSVIFGLPTLGFGLYWTAEFLGLKVKQRKRAISAAEAEALRAQLAALGERVSELEGTGERVARLEQEIEFLQRLLEQPNTAKPLPSSVGEATV